MAVFGSGVAVVLQWYYVFNVGNEYVQVYGKGRAGGGVGTIWQHCFCFFPIPFLFVLNKIRKCYVKKRKSRQFLLLFLFQNIRVVGEQSFVVNLKTFTLMLRLCLTYLSPVIR